MNQRDSPPYDRIRIVFQWSMPVAMLSIDNTGFCDR
jgi:hypothetical protein